MVLRFLSSRHGACAVASGGTSCELMAGAVLAMGGQKIPDTD